MAEVLAASVLDAIVKRNNQPGSTTLNAVILRTSRVTGVTAARPNADLSVSGTVTPSSGSLRWAMVDEVVLGSDYNDMVTVSSWVRFGTTPVILNYEATIQRLGYGSYVSNPAPTGTAQYTLRDPVGGSEHLIRQWGQNAAPGPFEDFRTTRPWDSQPWSVADVRNLQILTYGATILSNTRWHQAFINVYWTAPLSFTVDAVIQREQPGASTLGSWFRREDYAEFSTTLDYRWVYEVTALTDPPAPTIDAFIRGYFRLNAVIQGTVTHATLGTIGHTHASTEAANPTWTHVPQTDARAIVVVLSATDASSTVTYGNKPLTVRRQTEIFGRWTEAWTLEDLSGRTDDVVRVTGIGNAYASSTILSFYQAALEFNALSAVSGWTGWSPGDFTNTMSVGGLRVKALFSIGGGEGTNAGEPGPPKVVGYGTGTWLSGASTSPDNSGSLVLTKSGPDTASITGGFTYLFGDPNIRYYWSLLMSGSSFRLAPTIDAIKAIHPVGAFTVSSWFRHEFHAEFSVEAEAIKREVFEAQTSVGAWKTGFHTNAVIVGPKKSGITVTSVAQAAALATNPTWTHVPQAGDRALVVVLHRFISTTPQWVTYGGIPLRLAHSLTTGHAVQIWYLDDIRKPRANDIIVTGTLSNTDGTSLMLASAGPITLSGVGTSVRQNNNGQTLAHIHSSADIAARLMVGVATMTGTVNALTWEDMFDLGAGMVSHRTLTLGSTNYDSNVMTKDGGVTRGPMTGSVSVLTTALTDYISVLFTSSPGEGSWFGASALIGKQQAGFRTIDATKKATMVDGRTIDYAWGPGGAFGLDAFIPEVVPAEFAAGSWLRLEGYAEASFELEAEVGPTYVFGFPVAAWILQPRFALDAFIASALYYDSRTLAVAVTAPLVGQPMLRISGNMAAFTHDATDPTEVQNFTQTASPPYTAWIKLDVVEAGLYRIDDWVGAATGLVDSIMAIWGPQASPPGVGAEPWHLSDDGDSSSTFDFERSSFSDFGQNDGLPGPSNFSQYGTNYNGPVNFGRTDAVGSGITLAVGTYWIEIVPFQGANWVTSQGPAVVNIARMSRPTGSFAVDAVIMPRFRIEASIGGIPTTIIPLPYMVEWVQPANVLGALPERQPQGATALAFVSQAGAAGNGVSRVVTKPTTAANDLLIAFISGDEENLARGILAPGWEQYAYFPLASHEHAGWIVWRRAHAWEPTTYTFYWEGQVHGGSMAITLATYRNATLGMLRTITDQTNIPSGGTHRTEMSVGFAGQVVLAAFMGNAFSGAFSTIPGLTTHTSQSTNFAQVRVGRSPLAFTTQTPAQYTATLSGSSVRVNAVLGVVPHPYVPGFTLDAFIAQMRLFAVIQKTFTPAGFTLNASKLVPTIAPEPFTIDYVWVQGRFQPKAVITRNMLASKTIDAVRMVPDFGQGTTTVDAVKAYRRLFILRATIEAAPTRTFALDAVSVPTGQGTFAAAAVISDGIHHLTLDAWLLSRLKRGWFTLDARLRLLVFPFALDAWIGPPPFTVTSSFGAAALIGSFGQVTHTFEGEEGYGIDAVVDSYWSETTFSIDADITGLTKLRVTTLDAELSIVGEERGQFSLDATYGQTTTGLFMLTAVIEKGYFRLDAVLAGIFSLDAVLAYDVTEAAFSADAVLLRATAASMTVDADLRGANEQRAVTSIDSVVAGPQGGAFVVSGHLVRVASGSFSLAARKAGGVAVDAFVQPYFTAGAYIASKDLVVWPPSHEGTDGSASGDTLTDPTADFTPDLVGQGIVIGGEPYTIVAVPDGQTVVVDGTIPPGTGIDWYIPSGSATDAIGGPPPVTRKNRVRILWARPFTDDWHDITADVYWRTTRFTQSGRIGAGSFELHLWGAFADFKGGEEIRVTVDGFVVFGGYTMDVMRGYVFSDADETTTVLRGVDYNIVLDKLIVYNAAWDEQQGGSGEYRVWQPFDKGTSDQDIIRKIARDFIAPMPGFDFHTYVDAIETPAPTTKWTMQAGTTLRDVLTEISRITEGVWWMDPYRNLQYHDRHIVTAGTFPITDGDGGISCRQLSLTSDISIVTNDVIAWGTESYEPGDASIMYDHQRANAAWSVLHWRAKIEDTEARIERLRDIPYGQRTTKQRTELAALKRSLRVQEQKLADAQAQGGQGSIQRYGRWQYAEFRQDIVKPAALERRVRAILNRYGEPVQKGEATVFDHGFQAGQVVFVSSVTHGVTGELPIREMTIDFAVGKEPEGTTYWAVPRYTLALGLDPEEPWNVYQYLPFPEDDDQPKPRYNKPGGPRKPPPEGEIESTVLDDFTRDYESDTDFGLSTSERVEIRPWGPPVSTKTFTLDAELT